MKPSSVILLVTFVLLLVAMLASNLLLKKEYDKIDRSDVYWTYGKILEQPFKHIKIEGGNLTRIAFEPSKKPSVRVLKSWRGYDEKMVKALVRHDTLFLKFPEAIFNPGEKRYLGFFTMVRIFSPELLSVDGFNTRFGMFKMKQKNIRVNMSGRSQFEVESYIHNLDSVYVTQTDSSEVVFEMSPDLKGTDAGLAAPASAGVKVKIDPIAPTQNPSLQPAETPASIHSWETMSINMVDARLRGVSVLDIGHAQINSLKLAVADTSAVVLSGEALARYRK